MKRDRRSKNTYMLDTLESMLDRIVLWEILFDIFHSGR